MPVSLTKDDRNQLQITVIGDLEATVCSLEYEDPTGQVWLAIGSAKKHPKDRYSGKLGTNLAVTRALYDLADRLAGATITEIYE
jgi:hypothetical protein